MRLRASGLTEEEARCGVLEVAGQSVGAAFVGATTACLVLAEVLRVPIGTIRSRLHRARLELRALLEQGQE